jgi:DNA-directed RNA polymerase subunit RPC12/RpoP
MKPIANRGGKIAPETAVCPRCGAPHDYIYDNAGGRGSYRCKVCGCIFNIGENLTKSLVLTCPYCASCSTRKTESILPFTSVSTSIADTT